DEAIFEMGLPILGICYGMQLMALKLDGKVEKAQNREYGKAELKLIKESKVFEGLPEEQIVWMSHGDLVTAAPPGFEVIGTSASCPIASMADESRKFYGVQFHPEVRHSVYGNELLRQFVFGVCGMAADWSMENYIELEIEKIREEVGDK